MTDKEWFTVSEISNKLNIPVETIRRYIRAHSIHLKAKKINKKYFIHNESMTVIKQIRNFYDRGMNAEEVEESLSAQGVPMTITIKNDHDEPMTVHVTEELKEIKVKLEKQEKFNQELMKRLDDRDKYIKESLERRDQQLIESLKATLEVNQGKLEAAPRKEEAKRGFFQRLFNK
ncbi:helix-turn-helix domain-containing protein [Bacillus velezensis]